MNGNDSEIILTQSEASVKSRILAAMKSALRYVIADAVKERKRLGKSALQSHSCPFSLSFAV
jgi:hypothetical protein